MKLKTKLAFVFAIGIIIDILVRLTHEYPHIIYGTPL